MSGKFESDYVWCAVGGVAFVFEGSLVNKSEVASDCSGGYECLVPVEVSQFASVLAECAPVAGVDVVDV